MSEPRVYHSFRSPYSRLGLHIIKRAGITTPVIPFTGPPEGVAFNDPTQNKLKMRYYMQDAPRMTMRMGLPMLPPRLFDVDFTPANRALVAAERENLGIDFAIAVSDARWGEGKDVSNLDVLREAAKSAGWNSENVAAAQEDPSIDAVLQEYRELIKQDGVFGVPFGVVGDQKFWGQDRFELFVDEILTAGQS